MPAQQVEQHCGRKVRPIRRKPPQVHHVILDLPPTRRRAAGPAKTVRPALGGFGSAACRRERTYRINRPPVEIAAIVSGPAHARRTILGHATDRQRRPAGRERTEIHELVRSPQVRRLGRDLSEDRVVRTERVDEAAVVGLAIERRVWSSEITEAQGGVTGRVEAERGDQIGALGRHPKPDPTPNRPPVGRAFLDDRLGRHRSGVRRRSFRHRLDRHVAQAETDLQRRRGVLALVLTHLPLATDHPCRISELRSKPALWIAGRLGSRRR